MNEDVMLYRAEEQRQLCGEDHEVYKPKGTKTMKTPYSTDNNKVKQFITATYPDVYDKDSFTQLVDSRIDDILYGAARQGDWNIKTSPYKLFMMLAQLETISVENIGKLMNPKQEALYGKPYSKRTLQGWVAILSCGSGGLAHAIHTGNIK
jgi:hypothetical protein